MADLHDTNLTYRRAYITPDIQHMDYKTHRVSRKNREIIMIDTKIFLSHQFSLEL